MPITWDEYLAVPRRDEKYVQCRSVCGAAFDQQRRHIERLIGALSPRAVACLGAGVLNDVPYASLVCAGVAIHLVDWAPGSIDAGLSRSIVLQGDDGGPQCLYCEPSVACPDHYCRHFVRSSPTAVCDRFVPQPDNPLQCSAFERAEQPHVYYEDVTGGYATSFARLVAEELRDVRSWRQAFAKGAATAERALRRRTPLSLADASQHLVTSSMLLSQFEHEPYGYFAKQAAAVLGQPTAEEERRLSGDVDALRTTLLLNQVECHCQEIARILAPGGKWYVSFELFSAGEGNRWFVATGMPRVLEALGRGFTFNFDLLPSADVLTQFETRAARSLVCGFVLEAKPR